MSKILVVDDEPVVLNLVAATLQREKYDVLTAASAVALEQAKLYEGDISLLIVNHSVDFRSGRTLVDEILPVQPQMKVLRFSGHLESQLRARGEMRPESFFVQKPFMPKELVGKVREIIGLA